MGKLIVAHRLLSQFPVNNRFRLNSPQHKKHNVSVSFKAFKFKTFYDHNDLNIIIRHDKIQFKTKY